MKQAALREAEFLLPGGIQAEAGQLLVEYVMDFHSPEGPNQLFNLAILPYYYYSYSDDCS